MIVLADWKKLMDRAIIALLMVFLITFLGYLVSALQVKPRKDEIEYLWRAQALLDGNIEISPQHNYFFSVVLAVGFFIFGDKLVVAQILSALIGALVVFPSYFLARELFQVKAHARELGLVSAMLVSITLMPFSVDVRNDPLFLFFFLISYYFMIKSVKNQKNLRIAGIFAGLTFLTRDQGLLILPVLVLYFFLNMKQEELKRQRFPIGLKRLLNRNLLLALLSYTLVVIPKLFWKWYFFGSPFYIRNKNFWLDNYEDKYNTPGFIPQSEFQPSLRDYLTSHTIQQMVNRWLLGAYRMLEKLQNQLTIPVFSLALIGLVVFRKRREWILHLNLGLWFVVFSWLFGLRPTTRWIISVYPLLIIPATAIVMEIVIRIVELLKVRIIVSQRNLHKGRWQQLPYTLGSTFKRGMNFIQANLTSKGFISFLVVSFVITAFIPLFTIRTYQVYEQSMPSQNYLALMEMVDWVEENTPEDALFMTRDGQDLLFYYAHRKSVITPNGKLSFILQVIYDLDVDYLIIDSETLQLRPALKDIFTGKILPEGFSLVYWNYIDVLPNRNDKLEIKIFLTRV